MLHWCLNFQIIFRCYWMYLGFHRTISTVVCWPQLVVCHSWLQHHAAAERLHTFSHAARQHSGGNFIKLEGQDVKILIFCVLPLHIYTGQLLHSNSSLYRGVVDNKAELMNEPWAPSELSGHLWFLGRWKSEISLEPHTHLIWPSHLNIFQDSQVWRLWREYAYNFICANIKRECWDATRLGMQFVMHFQTLQVYNGFLLHRLTRKSHSLLWMFLCIMIPLIEKYKSIIKTHQLLSPSIQNQTHIYWEAVRGLKNGCKKTQHKKIDCSLHEYNHKRNTLSLSPLSAHVVPWHLCDN